jgi:hypothetical protein
MPNSVRHISIGISRPFEEVYAFLAEPANFPKWASGLGHSFRHLGGMEWLAETPMGRMTVRFTEQNRFGVLDHSVTPDDGAPMHNPMRAFPNRNGTEVVFSVSRRPGMSEEDFDRDAEWVARDLSALKRLLEQNTA